MRTYFGFRDQKSADQKTRTRYAKWSGPAFLKTFVDCAAWVRTASRVWIHMWRQFQLCGKQKKNWLQPLYYKCPWAML